MAGPRVNSRTSMLQDAVHVRDKIISIMLSWTFIWNCRTKHLGIILLLWNMISHQILKRLQVQRNEIISNLSNVNKMLVQWCVDNCSSQIVRRQTLLKFCGVNCYGMFEISGSGAIHPNYQITVNIYSLQMMIGPLKVVVLLFCHVCIMCLLA